MSERTCKSYKKAVQYFAEHKGATSGWESAPSLSDVRSWRDALLDKGTSAKTVCYYLNVLRGFFEFACDEELGDERYFESNPVLKKVYPIVKANDEESKDYDKVLSPEDIIKLWANERKKGVKELWARNYAIVTLLLDSKIRNAELLDLKLSDIHFADANDPDDCDYIIVRKGKGNKYREVDITPISVTALKLYLKSGTRPADLSVNDYLFGTTAEHAFGGRSNRTEAWHRGTGSWLSALVEKHIRDVTGKSGFRTHSLRHNGAVIELNNGVSAEELQAQLGHASVATTQLYSGKLLSKRNRKGMSAVIAVRDEWARKNALLLAGA
jgi:site-specific recombinase XerD